MKPIVGTWRLVATRAWDDDGQALPPPYGPQPLGLVVFDGRGRMLAALCDGRGDAGSGFEYLSYTGCYRLDGDTLVTVCDAASDAARVGTEQVRGVQWQGERLKLTPPPRRRGEVTEHRELLWEQVGGAADA